MERLPLAFSMLFFIAFIIYLSSGIHFFNLNPKANLNKVLLALCISLCFWSLGFSMAGTALNHEAGLFWGRISMLGWAPVYSILLHFLLLLAGKGRALEKGKAYLILYLPGAVAVYVFSISEKITLTQCSLAGMDYCRINIMLQNGWARFFQIYYIGYALICLVLICFWGRKTDGGGAGQPAGNILGLLFAAFILGTLADLILCPGAPNPLPQMTPILAFMPLSVMFYQAKRYGLMREVSNGKNSRNSDLILSGEIRSRLYYYLSLLFITGGLLVLLSNFFHHMIAGRESLESMIFTGLLFFVLGIALLVIRMIKDENIKGFLILLLSLLSIPIIILRFIEFAAITVWAFPIILMIVSLLFDTRGPLILIAVVAIITEITVWINAPPGAIMMDEFDHVIRIGIFAIALWIGAIVNNIYLGRLKENLFQTNLQGLISKISFDFVSVNKVKFDGIINNMLEEVGLFFQVDRAKVFLVSLHEEGTMTYAYEWCNEGIEPHLGTIQNVPTVIFPWWMEQLKRDKEVVIRDVSGLPDGAAAEKARLNSENIKSLVAISIEESGELLGFMGFDSVKSKRSWSNHHIKSLKIFANLLADGLLKIKAEEEIEYMAYYDQLTGLPNRNLFSDRLNQAILLAERDERFIGVILVDLDNFKMINEAVGHRRGDALIKEVAKSLVKPLRKADTIARFGGDKYMILINNMNNGKDITKIIDKIMAIFRKSFVSGGNEFFLAASAGIAVYPIDGQNAETLIKNADIAVHRAKSEGKGGYVLCSVEIKEEVRKNIALSNNLYRALERGELFVHYQPQVNLRTGRIIGVEALLRWRHPQMGMIPPKIFVPLAEKNGLINSIGYWVLSTACSQNKKWQEAGLPCLRMAVNLSIMQFTSPGIVDSLGTILKETGLAPKYLELEITESIASKEVYHTMQTLNRLKKLGVSISIDDFGMEYSSLNRLKILPIDRIKIDMQFIQGIDSNEKDKAITQTIINLAKSLKLDVLAEGVETAVQLEFLSCRKCDEVQGFYYYRPMPAKEIEGLLRDGHVVG